MVNIPEQGRKFKFGGLAILVNPKAAIYDCLLSISSIGYNTVKLRNRKQTVGNVGLFKEMNIKAWECVSFIHSTENSFSRFSSVFPFRCVFNGKHQKFMNSTQISHNNSSECLKCS